MYFFKRKLFRDILNVWINEKYIERYLVSIIMLLLLSWKHEEAKEREHSDSKLGRISTGPFTFHWEDWLHHGQSSISLIFIIVGHHYFPNIFLPLFYEPKMYLSIRQFTTSVHVCAVARSEISGV